MKLAGFDMRKGQSFKETIVQCTSSYVGLSGLNADVVVHAGAPLTSGGGRGGRLAGRHAVLHVGCPLLRPTSLSPWRRWRVIRLNSWRDNCIVPTDKN